MRSTDIVPAYNIPLAERAHHALMDLLAACRGPRDEEVLRLRLNGATQTDIAEEMGFSQSGVSRRLYDLIERADFEHLGLRLRGRRERAVPTNPTPSGLRFARHRTRRGHRDCWCRRAA